MDKLDISEHLSACIDSRPNLGVKMSTDESKACDVPERIRTGTNDDADIDVTSIAEGDAEEVSTDSVEVSVSAVLVDMVTGQSTQDKTESNGRKDVIVKTEKDIDSHESKDRKVPMSVNEGPAFNCADTEDVAVEDITERDNLDRFYFESDHLVLKDNKE